MSLETRTDLKDDVHRVRMGFFGGLRRDWNRFDELWVRVHRARGVVFLRPRTVGDGEPDVSVRGDADDWTKADGEVFRETAESTRGVLFHLWVVVGAVWMAVFRVVGGRVRVRCAV